MRWQSIFIAVFLAVQVIGPLSYYGCRDDRFDERFAWRMFSPERMVTCKPTFTVGTGTGERVELGLTFHQAWIKTAQRGRVGVVDLMARELCERYPSKPVRVELTCREIDGSITELSGGHDVCLTGSIR
jgi:hypothetical protein